MLVFAKNIKGIIHADRYRIYGAGWGHEPSDIPYEVYSRYKGVLSDATYREEYLKKIFNKDFPEIAFKYSDLRYLPDETLNKILNCLEVKFNKKWPLKRKVEIIKDALRNGIKTN